MVRGMAVDEAVKQLGFVLKKGAVSVRDTILEAQQLAVDKHNVEFKSNLWVGKFSWICFVNSCTTEKFLIFSGIFCNKGESF